MQATIYRDLNNENSTFKLNNNFNLFESNNLASSFNKMDNLESTSNSSRRIIKEGWLNKRGEHIKNWRPRYFYLYDDGNFIGYKQKPDSTNLINEPILNNFTVQNCQLIKLSKPKENTFILRGSSLFI